MSIGFIFSGSGVFKSVSNYIYFSVFTNHHLPADINGAAQDNNIMLTIVGNFGYSVILTSQNSYD